MTKEKLSAEGEVIAAHGAALIAAFQVLIHCLEEREALLPGQFAQAVGVHMELVKSRTGGVSDIALALLHDLRTALLNWSDVSLGLCSRQSPPQAVYINSRRACGALWIPFGTPGGCGDGHKRTHVSGRSPEGHLSRLPRREPRPRHTRSRKLLGS